jgi:FKBP-type peptidyl-prolyl cis-trans isomerase SlyD
MSAGRSVQLAVEVVVGCVLAAATLNAEQGTEETQMAPTVHDGAEVSIDYTLTIDGEVVDSSSGREPLRYVHGQGQIVPGLERELTGMSTGETKDITVSPEDGYGSVDPDAFLQVGKAQLPSDVAPEVGMMLRGTSPEGQPFRARIHEIRDDSILLDLNHPLAGKTLQFHVKVVDIGMTQ